MKIATLVLFSAVLALASASSAHAQYPYAWPNNLGPTAFGVSGTMYGLGLVPTPPYFALHPPVYYSGSVPRSYGYSPYAYPGCVPTPEIELLSFPEGEAPAPSEEKSEELPSAQPASKVASRGQWIENPFMANPAHGMIANPFAKPNDGAPLALSSQ